MHNINDNHPENKADLSLLHQLTLISLGTMAYIFVNIIHEVIGHGVTSLILGNKITLLTSVYFRSSVHSFITDAFGPILNLIAGVTILIVLKQVKVHNLYIKLLLILTMAFNFFWFSWMCLYCGITNKGDFAFYIPGETQLLLWRLFLIVSGLLSYYLTFKATAKTVTSQLFLSVINIRQLFSIPYLSAGLSALIAVSFYRPLSFDNFYEAFVFPMFLPVLFFAGQIKKNQQSGEKYYFEFRKSIILSGIILFILFCLTMEQGLKF